MQIERSKPFARGVADLMYVGDVPTPPVASSPSVDVASAIPAAALGYFALKSKGTKRWLLAGAAAYFGLRAMNKLPSLSVGG